MLKYAVSIGYYSFEFDDAREAVEFCITANEHEDENSLDVTLDFIDVPDEPELANEFFEDEEDE